MLDERLLMPPFRAGGPDRDVVLGAWVRLGRNLEDALFPNRASITEAAETRSRILAAVAKTAGDRIELLPERLDQAETLLVAERGWSERGASVDPGRGLAVLDGGATVLAINDVDHLRIVSYASGNDGEAALERARAVDEVLDAELSWAATPDLGYLTARLDEGGSALRVSALVFVPGIIAAGVLERVVRGLVSSGIEPRVSAWGRDAETDPARDEAAAPGSASAQPDSAASASAEGAADGQTSPYVELSCRAGRGIGEDDFLAGFHATLAGLIEGERKTRDRLLASRRAELEDAAWRAAAVLGGARLLPEAEARRLIADLRAGTAYGVAPPVRGGSSDPYAEIDRAREIIGTGHVRVLGRGERGGPSGDVRLDAVRAALVREVLPRYDIG